MRQWVWQRSTRPPDVSKSRDSAWVNLSKGPSTFAAETPDPVGNLASSKWLRRLLEKGGTSADNLRRLRRGDVAPEAGLTALVATRNVNRLHEM